MKIKMLSNEKGSYRNGVLTSLFEKGKEYIVGNQIDKGVAEAWVKSKKAVLVKSDENKNSAGPKENKGKEKK